MVIIYDHRGDPIRQAQPAAPAEPERIRRWDSAKTDRLNRAHWANASGQPINSDLSMDLETLVTRCTHEASNNPLLEGVIETFVSDLVGPDGPTLSVQSDSDEFNDWAEGHVEEFAEDCDIEGQLPLPDMISLWTRMLWKAGEYLLRYLDDPDATGPVRTRIQNMHPRRMATPLSGGGAENDNRIVLGVELNKNGKVVARHVQDPPDSESSLSFYGPPRRYDAEYTEHRFRVLEPGQVRGVPWAASCLQVIADIRDADNQLLDAIRAAADYALFAYCEDPGQQPIIVTDSEDYQRRQMNYLPPGYKPGQVKPEQPTADILKFRDERLREIGRPVNMPLMKVKLSSENHNYSQAKFDAQGYFNYVRVIRAWICRTTLKRMFNLIVREALLAEIVSGRSVPRRPRRVKLVWKWPGFPSPDPYRDAQSWEIYRRIGAATMSDVLADRGKSVEQHVTEEAREQGEYDAAGVEYPPRNARIPGPGRPDNGPAGDSSQRYEESDRPAYENEEVAVHA